MSNPVESLRDRQTTRLAVPAWVIYVLAALLWPLLLQLLIIIPGTALGLGGRLFGAISSIAIPLIVFFVSAWIGRGGRRVGAPERLWIVPVVWAVIATAFSLFGFLLSDTPQVLGLFGVLGTYVLGALGFWLGIRAKGHKPEHPGEQSII
jgi:hypothetical protein